MKQYATKEEYQTIVGDDTIPSKIDIFLQNATLKIDSLTFNRIVDLHLLTPFQQELVKRATCLQAHYLVSVGDADHGQGKVASWSSLDISVSYEKGEGNAHFTENAISKESFDLLLQTGLMWRGV